MASETVRQKTALLQIPAPARKPEREILNSLTQRWNRYGRANIDMTISPHDDMFSPGQEAHYLSVCISALEAISEAMLLARRDRFDVILDLPCGGGRVTRHLVKFFDDTKIFVNDLEKPKENFVTSHFGVRTVEIPADFSGHSARKYDLIFMGSLVTHFDEALFRRTIDYCIDALTIGGLLVVSAHGRLALGHFMQSAAGDEYKRVVIDGFSSNGFGYFEYPGSRERYGINYGGSFNTMDWAARMLQPRGDVIVLGYKEIGWANHHDVLTVERIS
jgi:SAM-dependent methyltransferase